VYFDTAVLVASSIAGHPHHREALAALESVHGKAAVGFTSGHGLAEMYAVLTRTPFTPAIYPSEAWELISGNILPYFEISSLPGKIYQKTIEDCAKRGWIGGRVYDALHLSCAKEAGCDRIYTFNVKHFQQLAPELAGIIGAPSGFR
jgi:predicted nucleic acid-binding protein